MDFKEFFESQLQEWPLAAKNVSDLRIVRKKAFTAGDLKGYVQYNPDRAVSTLAKVDKQNISERKCFLCSQNRPEQQRAIEILDGWQLLVNPYPILPYHFTIAGVDHIPQKLQLETGKKLASLLPDMVVFFNAEGAGASAPDHIHFQAVPRNEMPLINLLNETPENEWENLNLPFKIQYRKEDLKNLEGPSNVYFWVKDSKMYVVAVPRKSHRPSAFFKEGSQRRAFSPGGIDMAGVLVTPFEEDFEAVTDEEIRQIYSEVGY